MRRPLRTFSFTAAAFLLFAPRLYAQEHQAAVDSAFGVGGDSGWAEMTTSGHVGTDPALYYAAVGRGSPTIIVLHGGPGLSHDYLRPEWDRLAAEHRLVYYDQRGCGRSGPSAPYTWRADVADLDRLIEHVAPGEKVVLAGSSWGSWLALLYALEHPERVKALTLSGTPPWWHEGLQSHSETEWLRSFSGEKRARLDSINSNPHRRVSRASVDSVSLLKGSPGMPPSLAGRLARPLQEFCPDVSLSKSASYYDVPPVESLYAVSVPVLFLRGADTSKFPDGSQRIARVLENASIDVIEEAGHDPWFEQPEQFFSRIESFLASLPE